MWDQIRQARTDVVLAMKGSREQDTRRLIVRSSECNYNLCRQRESYQNVNEVVEGVLVLACNPRIWEVEVKGGGA